MEGSDHGNFWGYMPDYIQRTWGKPYNSKAGYSTRPSQHSDYRMYQLVRYWNPIWIINHTFKAKTILHISSFFLLLAREPHSGPPRAYSFTRFLDYIQRRTVVGRTPLNVWPARHTDYPQHSQQKNIHVSVEFEPTISAGARPQTYALDRAATGTGTEMLKLQNHAATVILIPTDLCQHSRNFCRILCTVDRASLYNLVNRANLVHKFS